MPKAQSTPSLVNVSKNNEFLYDLKNLIRDLPINNYQAPPLAPQNFMNQPRNQNNLIKVERLVESIPAFSGAEPGKAHEFVSKVDNLIRIVNPEQHELLCTLVKNRLTGDAEQLVRHLNMDHWQVLRGY